ncbi:unnamed protein product [Bathycoccus prasinos]|uniref:Unnamed protein product n=1 Tax=Bathycoccus prasinos TaxID=41875 RepID=K8EP61_9CHLO|nr:unnamed protein product [Bathycoccus prasinos]CCO20012.1 unnamed protein product [Bathycoccus prasinos]|eukprot:XP_007508926.1 unnamed protein product [Bathycoccus prasinos]
MKSSCRRFGGLLGGLRGGKGEQLHHSLFVSSFSSSSRSYQVQHSKDDQTETKRLLDLLNKKRANGNYVEGGLFEHENHRNERTKQKQTLLLYRKALRQAKRFPDPTLRHFGYHRIAEQFRRHRCELAKKKIRVWKKEATKQSRRMERAIRGDRDDYRHFLELAYGVKGRFGHLMRRFEEERKIEKTRRQEKFLLKPIDEETMETFSVKNLVRMVEDASLREGAKFEEQMEVLKRKVPTFYYDRRKSFSRKSDKSKSNDSDSSDDIFAYEDSRARSRATEDAIDAIELGDVEDDAEEKAEKEEVILLRSKLKHWHVHEDTAFEKYAPSRLYHGFDGNWENNHVAMLKSIFEPTMIDRLDFMPRKWFRTYRRTLFELEGESNSSNKSNKNQQNVSKISSDALKDVQRTTPLRIVLPAESDDEQKEREYSNVSYNTKEGEHEEKSMLSANKNRSTKAGKIKLAESTLYAD